MFVHVDVEKFAEMLDGQLRVCHIDAVDGDPVTGPFFSKL
jgi:hypothetical protein